MLIPPEINIKNKISREIFDCFGVGETESLKIEQEPNYVDKYFELERKFVLARDREEDLTRHLRNSRAKVSELEEKIKALNERLDKKIDEEIEKAYKKSDYYKNSMIVKILKFFRLENGWI